MINDDQILKLLDECHDLMMSRCLELVPVEEDDEEPKKRRIELLHGLHMRLVGDHLASLIEAGWMNPGELIHDIGKLTTLVLNAINQHNEDFH